MMDKLHITFQLPDGFTAVHAHMSPLQIHEAYIAVGGDGVVEGGCFTESEITQQWFDDAITHGAVVLRGPRSIANSLFGQSLSAFGEVRIVEGYEDQQQP